MWEANKIAYKGFDGYVRAYKGRELLWELRHEKDYSTLPLGLEVYDGSVQFKCTGTRATDADRPTLYYSYDAQTWNLWTTISSPITVNAGQTLYLYGPNSNIFSKGDGSGQGFRFNSTGDGKFRAIGLFMSLKNPDWTLPLSNIYSGSNYAEFISFFTECTNNLYDIQNLHINCLSTETSNFYNIGMGYMFNKCTKIEKGCIFDYPITDSHTATFIGFYTGCTSLKSATLPALSSTSAYRTFETMFSGCTSLQEIYYSGSIALNSSNSRNFSVGLPNIGTFYNLGGAKVDRGANGCPSTWVLKTSI